MSESDLDSTSLLLFDLLEDAMLLDLSRALLCLLFLECLVFGEVASILFVSRRCVNSSPTTFFYFCPSYLQRVSRGRSMVPYCTEGGV
jgi:hypothetical protein